MEVLIIMLSMALASKKWGTNTIGYLAFGTMSSVFVVMIGMLGFGLTTTLL